MLEIINGLTSKYRDRFKIERMILLKKYIEENNIDSELVYIYEINSSDNNKFNAVICSNNKENEMVVIDKTVFPMEVQLFDVLLKKDNEFFKDEKVFEEITNKISFLLNTILEEEKKEMDEYIISDHVYKVVEKGKDRIWIVDISLEENEEQIVIEETNITEETMKEIKEGTLLLFKNNEHTIIYNNKMGGNKKIE